MAHTRGGGYGNMAGSPDFEAGKTYRTRGGDKATIEDDGIAYPGFMTGRVIGGSVQWSWLPSGRISNGSDSPYDLLPGAIEDEKAVDPLCVLQEQIDGMQAQINDLFRQLQDVLVVRR